MIGRAPADEVTLVVAPEQTLGAPGGGWRSVGPNVVERYDAVEPVEVDIDTHSIGNGIEPAREHRAQAMRKRAEQHRAGKPRKRAER